MVMSKLDKNVGGGRRKRHRKMVVFVDATHREDSGGLRYSVEEDRGCRWGRLDGGRMNIESG